MMARSYDYSQETIGRKETERHKAVIRKSRKEKEKKRKEAQNGKE